MKFFIILVLVTVVFAATTPQKYKDAYELYKNKNYEESVILFNELINEDNDDFYSGNAYYWLGMIDYNSKKYQESVLKFLKVLTCKNEWKYADAMLKIANCYERLDMNDKAMIYYDEILKLKTKNEKLVSDQVLEIAKSKKGE
ncbi:MAG: tetratricopeptide repeat protein [Candidatus Delongbacteria bacterium]|nr:tetratricopeptide repeat protein [Candidatus Delongbacteria bacterium]MBN2833984.1 tetratricopeptide repeat protein [Candidatus Delongbacteria bacterium]